MTYFVLFYEFLKIGLFTFGGGYAMIPLLKEAVMRHEWLTEAQFYDFIGVCESTPGPIAVNMATYIGSVNGGILGSAIATFAVVLPSFIIILLIASVLKNFINNRFVVRALTGIKAVVLGLIIATGLTLFMGLIGYESLSSFSFNYVTLIILAILIAIYYGFYFIKKRKMNTILLIILSAIVGLIIGLI